MFVATLRSTEENCNNDTTFLLFFLSPQNKFDPNWSEEEKEAYYKRKQKTTFKVLQHPHVMKHPVYNNLPVGNRAAAAGSAQEAAPGGAD